MDDSVTTALRINLPSIACEVIDGEAVLINFEHGTYYSAQGAGGMILERLAEGTSPAELIAMVQSTFSGTPAAITSGVREFLAALLAEALIVEVPAGELGAQRDLGVPANAGRPPAPFVVPVLQKYEDLKDLLLLDPIHDTDEAGWPLAPG